MISYILQIKKNKRINPQILCNFYVSHPKAIHPSYVKHTAQEVKTNVSRKKIVEISSANLHLRQ